MAGSKLLYEEDFLYRTILLLDIYKYIDHSKILDKSYIMGLNNLNLPSPEWIDKQETYSINLSEIDSMIVQYYTVEGSYLVNDYLRQGRQVTQSIIEWFKSSHNFFKVIFFKYYKKVNRGGKKFTMNEISELMSDSEEIKKFIEFFITRLNKIIVSSPKVDKEFIVYRGKLELSRPDTKRGTVYSTDGFSSTSINMRVGVEEFAINGDKEFKYLEKIIIPPGSLVLWLNPLSYFTDQVEIVLPDRSQFRILEHCDRSTTFKQKVLRKIFHTEGVRPVLADENSYPIPTPMTVNLCLVEYIPK